MIKLVWTKEVVRIALLLVCFSDAFGQVRQATETATGPVFQGTEAAIDLPLDLHVKNIGAPKDGLGLCVFASLQMAAQWEGTEALFDLIHKVPNGGGWPEKVDHYLKLLAPDLPYVQYEGTNPAILDRAIAMGRPVCVTYGYGEFYRNETIAHMVLLAHLDDKLAAVIDNNDPGKWTWMTRDEFLKRWKHPNGKGWCVVLLDPPPPPVPSN